MYSRQSVQNLHALAAITLQSRQFFAMTLGDQLFEKENEDASKKPRMVCGNRTVRGQFNCEQHGFLQTRETVPLRIKVKYADVSSKMSYGSYVHFSTISH
jgi:hypothetical protein